MPFLLMMLGFGKTAVSAVGSWLSKRSLAEIIAIGLALLVVVQFVIIRSEKRHTLKVEKQLTAANGALNVSRANETALRAAIAKQIAAVANLAAKSAEQQKQAQDALRAAASRVSDAQTVAQRLRASAAQRPPGPACEPSETLKGQWK